MNECCSEQKNILEAPYKDLGCFKELSISIDETIKAPDYDTFLQKVENIYLKIKKHQNEIIKYFLVTYFALDNEHYGNNKDAMRLFLNNNSITIKTEFDPTSTGFLTKISFNEKPIEKIEREKKLLLEINRLEKHISNLKDELGSINEY